MTIEALLKLFEELLLAGTTGIIALGVRQLQAMAKDLHTLKVDIAVIVEKVREHDRRLNSLEKR